MQGVHYDHVAASQIDDSIEVAFGELRLMESAEECHAMRCGEPAEERQDLVAKIGIERSNRLIRQQETRLLHEGARNRDALLLAARELVGAATQLRRNRDVLERGTCLGKLAAAGIKKEAQSAESRPAAERTRHDVLVNGKPVDEIVLLWDHRDAPPKIAERPSAHATDIDAIDEEMSRFHRDEAADGTEQ